MTNLVLHKAEKYIVEDLDYYFSTKRDIHSQVRPMADIYSLTPDSPHLNIDFNDGKVGNIFFPFAPFSIDRIYIGISFPLYANNWGASFLRYLLTRVKLNGCIVLPVYPEMQAAEKNYWSRSLLENIFLSRSRWKGTSNIWAENDGVMSVRVGRKWPPKVKSTAKYLLAQGSNMLIRQQMFSGESGNGLADSFIGLHQKYWKSANISAVVERVIQDHFGRKKPLKLCEIGCKHTLLTTELLLSSYINIEKAVCHTSEPEAASDYYDMSGYFHHNVQQQFVSMPTISRALQADDSYHVIHFSDNYMDTISDQQELKSVLDQAWEKLKKDGVLIIYSQFDDQFESIDSSSVDVLLSKYGVISYYSSLVASKISDDQEISHYSSMLERELKDEKQTKNSVFLVVEKNS